ncbi:hypothetical protein JN531_003860 [Flagellatimonas centrodinii]|uniref:hypothetical protein n=1 Tax=Flagellatimonas centrodinii TaxID=2806210 RepID=UPI001FEEDB97|nr:hypothetical protein [Flagellatimonas centrodinii]ULQ47423.1 hypothetical protein JN531_003860 [Flagellatimonas centrodinii]
MRILDEQPSGTIEQSAVWWPVLFSPEPAMEERITVGIAMVPTSGKPLFRCITRFDRVRRLLGEAAARNLPFLLEHATTLIAKGRAPDTPHLAFGQSRELWSADPAKAIEDLFTRFVPLARAFDASAPRSAAATPNHRLTTQVYAALRLSENPRAADLLIPQNSLLRSSENPPRFLNVPIQHSGGQESAFATLVSAQSRNPNTIDKNVYPAVAELHAAARIHHVHKVAVFILRPDEASMPPDQYDEVDEHIHQTTFVLQNEGLVVMPEVSPELMAGSIQEWAFSPTREARH